MHHFTKIHIHVNLCILIKSIITFFMYIFVKFNRINRKIYSDIGNEKAVLINDILKNLFKFSLDGHI